MGGVQGAVAEVGRRRHSEPLVECGADAPVGQSECGAEVERRWLWTEVVGSLQAAVHDACGSASVELALLLPVVFLLILGVVDFGRATWTKNALSNISQTCLRVFRQAHEYVRVVAQECPVRVFHAAAALPSGAGPGSYDMYYRTSISCNK